MNVCKISVGLKTFGKFALIVYENVIIADSKQLWTHCVEAPWCRTMQKPSSLWISWWLSPQNCPFAMKQTTQNWGAHNLVIIFSLIQMLVCKSKIWYKLTKIDKKKDNHIKKYSTYSQDKSGRKVDDKWYCPQMYEENVSSCHN